MFVSSSVQGPAGAEATLAPVSCIDPVQPFGMPFPRLLKRSSQPTFARPGTTHDVESSTSDDSNIRRRGRKAGESMAIIHRPWKAKRPPSDPSQSTPTLPLTFKAKGPTTEIEVDEVSSRSPAIPGVLLTNPSVVPSPVMVPAANPAPDKLADAWDAVKGDPKIADRTLDSVGVSSAPSLFLWSTIC